MTKTVWVFPGQGSQLLGMGADLTATEAGKSSFAAAEALLGWSVLEICHQEDKLSRTLYTQPCLYVVAAIIADLLQAAGLQPDFVAGHSLGEYMALYAAGAFDFATGLRLVQQRALLMDQTADGQMVALVGFDREQLQTQLAQIPDVVLANDNHEAQVVISGRPTAVEALLSRIKVKRAVPLNVSGAFHSPLMAAAAAAFETTLGPAEFRTALVPVLANVDPTPATEPGKLKQRLSQQMTGGVRWREICLQFSGLGVGRAVEVGPGKVLTGLIKRTCPELVLENVGTLAEVRALAAKLSPELTLKLASRHA